MKALFLLFIANRLKDSIKNLQGQKHSCGKAKPISYCCHLFNSVIYSHEEDIAIRLQTRRDEERLRREVFLHEMELMYGRVQQQPLLFERYYAPRPPNTPIDFTELSPRKSPKKISRKKIISDRSSEIQENVMKYLEKIENDKGFEGSDGMCISDRM